MSRVCLVTGANGFIGSALVRRIPLRSAAGECFIARGAVRTLASPSIQIPGCIAVGDINSGTNWQPALRDVNVVIHCAGRAHLLKDRVENPLEEFRVVNVDGTLSLAEQALRAGVDRFIFLSSIGVNGSQTFDRPFSEIDTPSPVDPYAISKLEAEVALSKLFRGASTQLVIIRPPLVYGPNPPGNFRRLLKLAASGWPLPFGAIDNKRSFVALDNLVDLIITCIDHQAAANQTFLVSDDDDLSTPQLLRRIGDAFGKPVRLIPVPLWVLETGTALLGQRDLSRRLCGNLQVDIAKAKATLGWAPPVSMADEMRMAAVTFLSASGPSEHESID